MSETQVQPSTRRPLASAIVPAIIGVIGLITLMGRPRFAAFHTVDVIQLFASGMCFGVALVALIGIVRGQKRNH